jgi:hypothetical protein
MNYIAWMKKKFSKFKTNVQICVSKVGPTSDVLIASGQHDIDGNVTLVVMQFNTSVATGILDDMWLILVKLYSVVSNTVELFSCSLHKRSGTNQLCENI